MLTAGDVMTTNVITVTPETSIGEAAELLVRHRISAVPVIDPDGRVLGILSEGDLIRRVEIGTARESKPGWRALFVDRSQLAQDYIKSHGHSVQDVMTHPVVSVTHETPLSEIAQTLVEHNVKRVPVVRAGRLVGIVSRANLVQALVVHRGRLDVAIDRDDSAIRQAVLAELDKQDWVLPSELNVIVVDGVVQIWGHVQSEQEKHALRVAIETVPGVRQVEAHIGLASDWKFAG